MPSEIPPVVIVQHIPPVFSTSFAARLDQLFPFKVKEAEDGDAVTRNQILIAPGDQHMEVVKVGGRLKVRLNHEPEVNRHRPSVDVLFDSVAKNVGADAIGVILTGMGGDGARGMKRMRDVGCFTIAQDEASCVVYGMPKEAVNLGGVKESASLAKIPGILFRVIQGDQRQSA